MNDVIIYHILRAANAEDNLSIFTCIAFNYIFIKEILFQTNCKQNFIFKPCLYKLTTTGLIRLFCFVLFHFQQLIVCFSHQLFLTIILSLNRSIPIVQQKLHYTYKIRNLSDQFGRLSPLLYISYYVLFISFFCFLSLTVHTFKLEITLLCRGK